MKENELDEKTIEFIMWELEPAKDKEEAMATVQDILKKVHKNNMEAIKHLLD